MMGELAFQSGERDAQIESETIDADSFGPVSQRINGKGDHMRISEVKRIAASGGVLESAGVGLLMAVVGQVVQTAPADGRALGAAFAGVVVDHIHNHLEARLMQRTHHVDDLLANGSRALLLGGFGGVGGFGGKVAQGGVSPIVFAAMLLQEQFVLLGHNRQQFNGSDAQTLQISQCGGMGQAGVSAT